MKIFICSFIVSVWGFLLSPAAAQENLLEKTEALAKFESKRHDAAFMSTGIENFTAASDNFDVNYYRCYWKVDPAVRFIEGSVTVYYKMLNTLNNAIVLDLVDALAVDSVKQRSTLLTATRATNTVSITLAANNNPNLDSITIFYKGVPPQTGYASFTTLTHQGIPIMWTLSEPYGSRDWWPCKNGLDDKADSIDVFVEHPAVYKAASNGLLQSETPIANNQVVTHWKHRYPITSYLVCLAVTNYQKFDFQIPLTNASLLMQTFCYPESYDYFQQQSPKIIEIMQLFDAKVGTYPFIREKYGHVQCGFSGGMEHQTASFMGGGAPLSEMLQSHELAHQWFGDMVTCGSWEDIWLNEGFATQMNYYYYEQKYPTQTKDNRTMLIGQITALPDGSVWVNDTTSVSRIFSSRLSYNKGCYLLFMLRYTLGETAFFNAIKKYTADPQLRYGYARTADLKRHLEAESGQNLDWFFNEWFKGQGYPSYKISWQMYGNNKVKITLNQTTSHTSVPFFHNKIPLVFKKGTQEQTIHVKPTQSGDFFIEPIQFVPDTVLVDPELWILSKNNTTEKLAPINPPTPTGKSEITIDARSAPIFNIALNDFLTDNVFVQVIAANGQVVYNKSLTLYYGEGALVINTTAWARGTYYVRVVAGSVVKTLKISN